MTMTIETLTAVQALATRADASLRAYIETEECDDGDAGEHVVDWSIACDKAAQEAAAEAASADVPRPWTVSDRDSGVTDDLGVFTEADAREAAGDWVRDGSYDASTGTLWIDVRIACAITGEEARVTVTIDPDEPDCAAGKDHDWQSPHKLVGGSPENPGVWAKTGGILVTEVCIHCGTARVTDTWAQRHDTGEEGFTSIRYEEHRFAEEIAEGQE